MVLPIESQDFFEYWDSPLVETQNIEQLKTTFNDYRKDTEAWKNV